MEIFNAEHPKPEPPAGRMVGIGSCVALYTLAACLWFYPINCLLVRLGIIVCVPGALALTLWMLRDRKPLYYGAMSAVLVICGFLVCPGRQFDSPALRTAYLDSLREYEGTRYLWGGESKFGIDCSGLVRAGLINGYFRQGLRHLNPRLVRYALDLWWHDCSAEALGEQFRGQTQRVISTPSINALDGAGIQPGDLAVTASGAHVLAYLGGNEWIEADPRFKKVVIVPVPAPKNPWFKEPVNIVRWTELE